MKICKITQSSLNLFDEMLMKVKGLTPSLVYDVIARTCAHDEGVKQLLGLVYNPHTKYNVTVSHNDYNVYPEDVISAVGDVGKLLHILETLYTTGKNMNTKAKKALVYDYIETNSPHILYFIRGSLDCGFGKTGAKKMGIISAHSPQKGVLLHSLTDIKYPLIADFKYNGVRLTTVIDNEGNVKFRLLQGQVLKIPTLEQQIKSLDIRDCVLDGELVKTVHNAQWGIVGGITELDRLFVSGKITSATSTNSPMSMTGVTYVLYDYLEGSDVMDKARKVTVGYVNRRASLNTVASHPLWNNTLMTVGSAWQVHNIDEATTLIQQVKLMGGEGLMFKGVNSTYDHKKNKQWLKVKNIQECDLTVVAYKVHSRNSNWIGSLLCRGTVDGKAVKTWVGSGLNDSDRPISMFNQYIDKVFMVTYLDIVKGAKGYSLSNPRFVKPANDTPLVRMIRFDGNDINY